MLKIAIEMLMGDRVKYTILICAIAFATVLITQQLGVFFGIMGRTVSLVRNTNATIWVAHPDVEQVEYPFAFKDTYLDIIRSIPGVKSAWPLLYQEVPIKVIGGTSLYGNILGVDSQTLTGVPPRVIKGSVDQLWNNDSVAIDEFGINLLSKGLKKPLDVGDHIYINDHDAKIVAVTDSYPSFSSIPHLYMTYSTALEVLPQTRHSLAYVIVEPEKNANIPELLASIEQQTSLKAYTSKEMFWKTVWWVAENTGLVISFGTTVLLGFVVGIAVAGQTFYSFIYENSGNLAALKAMGISNEMIQKMILTQVLVAGFIGYGIGLFFTAIFGFSTFYITMIPFYINYFILIVGFVAVMLICLFSAFLGIQRINKLSPSEVFRG